MQLKQLIRLHNVYDDMILGNIEMAHKELGKILNEQIDNNVSTHVVSKCYNLADMEDAWIADNDMGTFEFWIESRNN